MLRNVMDSAPEVAEFDVLAHMNENGKMLVPLSARLEQYQQDALERLMLRDWIRLIDIDTVPTAGTRDMLMRVFLVMPAGRAWYRERVAS